MIIKYKLYKQIYDWKVRYDVDEIFFTLVIKMIRNWHTMGKVKVDNLYCCEDGFAIVTENSIRIWADYVWKNKIWFGYKMLDCPHVKTGEYVAENKYIKLIKRKMLKMKRWFNKRTKTKYGK